MASKRNKQHGPPRTPDSHRTPDQQRWQGLVLAFVILAATFIAYFPATSAGYVWDDNELLRENRLVHVGDGLYRFWFTTEAPDYWPLSSTTFWLEWRIWGDHPLPYHVFNILLHALSAVLFWRVLKRLNLGEPGAFLAALIFAIHPVMVESVVWISERKTVLSMVWYMLAVLAYLRFEDRGLKRDYGLAILAAAAALLAKTAVVMLPMILLLLIWWRRGTLTWRDIVRTAPFFLLSLILGLVTIWFQHHNAIGGLDVRPEGLASRIASVGWVVWFYLYKIVFPVNLAMIYPRWEIPGQNVLSFVPLILLIVGFVVLWSFRKRRTRGALVALASFVMVLMPVLGLLDMAYARFSLVADHLQYPGTPGVIALIGGGLAALFLRAWLKRKKAAEVAFVIIVPAIVLTLVALTWQQAGLYCDEFRLWSHTIAVNDRAWNAYTGRAKVLADRGEWGQALMDYSKAIELSPDDAQHYINRGSGYASVGDYARALKDYDKAIALDPTKDEAYHNRGMTYGRLNQFDKAISDLSQAIELNAYYYEAYSDRGTAYYGQQAYDRAIQDYTKAIVLQPDNATAYNKRGSAYASMGDHLKAIEDYNRAIRLQPNDAEVYFNRGLAYGRLQNYGRAVDDLTRSIELTPESVNAYYNRGVALSHLKDFERAIRDYTEVIERNPNYTAAYSKRAEARYSIGEYGKSRADIEKCQRLGGRVNAELIQALNQALSRPE